jgi:hypothetical protein
VAVRSHAAAAGRHGGEAPDNADRAESGHQLIVDVGGANPKLVQPSGKGRGNVLIENLARGTNPRIYCERIGIMAVTSGIGSEQAVHAAFPSVEYMSLRL